MEVLVCCFREVRSGLGGHSDLRSAGLTHLLSKQQVVDFISFCLRTSELVSNQVLWFSVRERQTTVLIVIISHLDGFLLPYSANNLWFRAKVMLLVLRVVLNRASFSVH